MNERGIIINAFIWLLRVESWSIVGTVVERGRGVYRWLALIGGLLLGGYERCSNGELTDGPVNYYYSVRRGIYIYSMYSILTK